MLKLSLFILLFTCQHVIAQTAPAAEAVPPINSNMQSDTVTNWLRAIKLLPNEVVTFKRGKTMDYIYLPPLLNLQAAIPKAVLIEKKDSLYNAAGSFVDRMRKKLHLNKTSKVVIAILYFDRYRCNVGLARSLVYFINGRKTIITDTTFDDSSFIDSTVSSRLDSITLAPNQYIHVDHEKQVLSVFNITKQCDKEEPLSKDPLYTRARMAALALLFKVLQHDYQKYKAVAYACVDPFGARKVEANGYEFEKLDLIHQYDTMYLDYLQDLQRWSK